MRLGDTPVPIPNTKVKTWAADGTALETVWESRWLPEQKKKKKENILIESMSSGRQMEEHRVWDSELVTLFQRGNAVCDTWFYQWLERKIKKRFLFLMTDKTSVKSCTLKTTYRKNLIQIEKRHPRSLSKRGNETNKKSSQHLRTQESKNRPRCNAIHQRKG